MRDVHTAAAIVVTAVGAADGTIVGQAERAVTLVDGSADAAGMWGRSGGRESYRKETSDER